MLNALATGTSTDPVADANRYMDAVHADTQDAARRHDYLKSEFIGDVMKRPLTEPSTIDGPRPAWTRNVCGIGGQRAYRSPSVGEVAAETLDFRDGPSVADLLAYVVSSAMAGCATATDLIERMGDTYATYKDRV